MARLIDADEAKARIIAFSTGCNSTIIPIDAVLMIINQIDTVPAVEVVRCKDCKKGHPELSLCDDTTWCVRFGRNMDLDGFCCMGERRTDG